MLGTVVLERTIDQYWSAVLYEHFAVVLYVHSAAGDLRAFDAICLSIGDCQAIQ